MTKQRPSLAHCYRLNTFLWVWGAEIWWIEHHKFVAECKPVSWSEMITIASKSIQDESQLKFDFEEPFHITWHYHNISWQNVMSRIRCPQGVAYSGYFWNREVKGRKGVNFHTFSWESQEEFSPERSALLPEQPFSDGVRCFLGEIGFRYCAQVLISSDIQEVGGHNVASLAFMVNVKCKPQKPERWLSLTTEFAWQKQTLSNFDIRAHEIIM